MIRAVLFHAFAMFMSVASVPVVLDPSGDRIEERFEALEARIAELEAKLHARSEKGEAEVHTSMSPMSTISPSTPQPESLGNRTSSVHALDYYMVDALTSLPNHKYDTSITQWHDGKFWMSYRTFEGTYDCTGDGRMDPCEERRCFEHHLNNGYDSSDDSWTLVDGQGNDITYLVDKPADEDFQPYKQCKDIGNTNVEWTLCDGISWTSRSREIRVDQGPGWSSYYENAGFDWFATCLVLNRNSAQEEPQPEGNSAQAEPEFYVADGPTCPPNKEVYSQSECNAAASAIGIHVGSHGCYMNFPYCWQNKAGKALHTCNPDDKKNGVKACRRNNCGSLTSNKDVKAICKR